MAVNGFDKRPQDINRKGAPKKDWTWAGLIEKIVDETDIKDKKQLKEKMVRAVVGKAIRGDVSAFKELTNRTDGLPKQTLDLKADININQILDELDTPKQTAINEQTMAAEPSLQDNR